MVITYSLKLKKMLLVPLPCVRDVLVLGQQRILLLLRPTSLRVGRRGLATNDYFSSSSFVPDAIFFA